MAASKQTWRVVLDEEKQEIRYYTRVDDKLRQTFKADELPDAIRNRLAIRGIKVTMEERNSQVPAHALDASMAARDAVWDQWKAGIWAKARQGGGVSVRIEIQALANVKGASVASIRKALAKHDEEEQEAILSSDAVRKEVERLQAEDAPDLSDLL